MSTQGHVRTDKSLLFWSQAVAVGIVLFPLSLHHVDYRSTFSQGLAISAHKSSPAYAAFEDLRENYDSELPVIPDNGRVLSAGQNLDFKLAQAAPRVRQIALKGVVIRAPAVLETVKPILVAPYTPRERVLASMPDLSDNQGRLLSLPERKQRLLNSLKEEDWTMPTPAMAARQLAEEALRSSLPGDRAPVSVARNDDSTPMGVHNPDLKGLRPLWLAGQVEMTGGLAFVGPEMQIEVKRMFNGQTFERGQIWVTEGKFEIRVKQATGFLVVEVHTRDGRILGRGELNLLDLGTLASNDRVGDLRIALRPSTDGATSAAISGYSNGSHKIAVADARIEIQAYSDAQKVNAEGIVNEPTLSRDSSFVARGLAPNHWPTLVVGQAHESQDIRLFSNSMVHALIGLTVRATDRKAAAQQAIVWGQITQNGKTIADAQVELAGDYSPIYFDEANYLPLPALKQTTSNGMFAFLQVKAGVQALRVRVGGKVYPAQVFTTEDKHVSYVELDVRDKAISQFKVFDGLDMNKPVSARLRLVGTTQALTVGRDDFVQYSVAANPFMVEAEAGAEYEVSRVTVTGSPHVVHVPLVQREWLYRLAADKKITPDLTRGNIVGFMDDHDFEVELTGYRPGEPLQIVYFDSEGKALDSKTGVAGGGFAIFNAPGGLQTVYIHPIQSRETFSQVLVAEPEFVQVIAH